MLTVLVKVARHKKGIQTEEMKQYVAWYLEQHHQQNLGVRIVLIFDFTDAGITNMVRFKPSVFSVFAAGGALQILPCHPHLSWA